MMMQLAANLTDFASLEAFLEGLLDFNIDRLFLGETDLLRNKSLYCESVSC